MGHDPNCAAWIRAYREPPPKARAAARAVAKAGVARVADDSFRHRVVFTPSGKRGEFEDGTSLLEAARKLGVDLDSVCGGRGICSRCQIEIADGEFAKHAIQSAAATRRRGTPSSSVMSTSAAR